MRAELGRLDERIAAAEALLATLGSARSPTRSKAAGTSTIQRKQKRAPWTSERRAKMMAIFAKRKAAKALHDDGGAHTEDSDAGSR
jgi:hypothetical protein